jgi:hypothetical protein
MEKLLELPPLAIITFGAVLALIFGVRYLGLWQGQNTSPAASAGAASVAAVIVDPAALNRASAAVEAFNVTQTEANMIAKKQVTATDRLTKVVEDLTDGVGDLRDEVIRSSAKMK